MAISPVAATAPAAATASASAGPRFPALLEAGTPRRPAGPPPDQSRVITALSGIERAQARLDAVLAAARAGRTFTAAELIGLQAEAYRCAQTVDLASKLVEQGAQSVKQALNTQL